MLASLSRNWWMLVLRGVLGVIFGLVALFLPDITLMALVLLFGAYALVDGVANLVTAWNERDTNNKWWVVLLEGIAGVAAGILAFIWPGITTLVLLYLIAAWAILTGVFEVYAAYELRREIDNEWLLGLAGVLSVVFGVLLFISPGSGALAVVWIIGIYALLFGVLMIGLGFRLKDWRPEDRTYAGAS